MPFDSSLVGTKIGPITAEIDARWTMAYAAGIGDNLPCYMDTTRTEGIVAHPMFPVCFEWEAAGAIRAKLRDSLTRAEAARGVHATQHMILHRPVRPPMRLFTTAELLSIEQRKPGAYEVGRFETVDDKGSPICTTYYGSLYREVEIAGGERIATTPAPPALAKLPSTSRADIAVPISAGAAHVYTECARIWNPVHTDAAVAAAARLPAIILHGTATLAYAVSRIIEAEAGNDPERVAEIYGRFGAMVLMPSEIIVRIHAREKIAGGEAVFFEALSAEGGRAVREGVVRLHA
jgi:acyl dehydratase